MALEIPLLAAHGEYHSSEEWDPCGVLLTQDIRDSKPMGGSQVLPDKPLWGEKAN